MKHYIDKDALIMEIEKRRSNLISLSESCPANTAGRAGFYAQAQTLEGLKNFINALEVKDPYEECVQYDSIKADIQAHAETYSFNIESELFNQLTKEQQKLWRKEIEQAVISGGDAGYSLAKDPRYKENLEVKEVEIWHLQEKEDIYDAVNDWSLHTFVCIMKDGTIQKFTDIRDEDYNGHISVHIDGVNNDYDNVDDIVKWIEYT